MNAVYIEESGCIEEGGERFPVLDRFAYETGELLLFERAGHMESLHLENGCLLVPDAKARQAVVRHMMNPFPDLEDALFSMR